jgi:hypothetical protein
MIWRSAMARLAVSVLLALALQSAARSQAPIADAVAAAEPTAVEAGDYTPSPRVAELIAALQRTEAAIESLEVEYVCLSNLQLGPPGKPPLAGLIEDDAVAIVRRATVSWVAHRDGRGRIDAAIERTHVRQDGSEVHHEDEHVSAFDGKVGAKVTRRRLPTGEIGEDYDSTNGVVPSHQSPFDLTVRDLGTPMSQRLVEGRATFMRDDEYENRAVAVVETLPELVSETWTSRREFWIDAERGVVVRRLIYAQRGPGLPWGLHLEFDATRFTEVRPGLWLPGAVAEQNRTVGQVGGDYVASRENYAIDKWTVNGEIAPQRFAVPGPP